MGFPKGFGKLRVTARNAALRTLLLTDAGMPVQAALDMALGAAPHAPAGQVGSAAFGTALAARDRHLCAELAYGCLRAEIRIDYVLGRVLPRPGGLPRPLRHILALGVYGLLLQDRTLPEGTLFYKTYKKTGKLKDGSVREDYYRDAYIYRDHKAKYNNKP